MHRSSPPPFRPRRACLGAALACVLAAATGSRAQDVGREALPGTDAERYLRALQVAGEAPLYPFSIRGFSPAEVDRLLEPDAHRPWAARTHPGGNGVHALRPRLDLAWNSAFPGQGNDGPVWAGRGLTVSGSLGVAARWGALSLRLEPEAFWTQNETFPLMDTGRPGVLVWADPQSPRNIDLPQRFGDGSYSRLDPGQSTLRLDARGFAVGVSTANQQWGPAYDQPLILGTHAPGFLHAFAGTSNPWKVGIGRVHGRLVWGDLRESAFSPAEGDARRRMMAGLVGVFLPRGLDGVEIGLSRFYHLPGDFTTFGARQFLRPLESFWRSGVRQEGPATNENQLASAWVRWVLPRHGVEVYGEYARDDHNYDLLDFLLEPDHTSSYLLGGSRAWRRGRSLLSLRAEWVSAQASHLAEVRPQGRLYRHDNVLQGHTHRGQLLGSPAGYGGGGSVVALEAFTPRGRWSVDWTRTRVRDNWGTAAADEPDPDAATDVVHSLGGEALWFAGRVDAVARLRGSWELNRQLRDDAFGVTASLGLRIGL